MSPSQSKSAAESERREVFYNGRVQGVGFRYTTRSTAGEFTVTGFVQNLPDGRVQLVAEGTREELDRFLECLERRMIRSIRGKQVTQSSAQQEFTEFEIRH